MLRFAFRGTIADIDETTSVEPCYPALALIVEVDDNLVRVVVPEAVLKGRHEVLCVDRPVQVFGEVNQSPHGPHHIATELRLTGSGH